jgi:hypothetical protein
LENRYSRKNKYAARVGHPEIYTGGALKLCVNRSLALVKSLQ